MAQGTDTGRVMPWSNGTTKDGQAGLVDRWHPRSPTLGEQRVKTRVVEELRVDAERVEVHIEFDHRKRQIDVDVEGITSSESEHLRAFLTYVLPGSWGWTVNRPEVQTEVPAELLIHLRERLLWRPKT